jgi:multiple sugar transport system permease protein
MKTVLRRHGVNVLVWLLLAAGALLMMIPLFWMISTALKEPAQAFQFPPTWIPCPLTLDAFRQVWKLVPFGRYLWNSFYIAITVTALEILTASLAAFAFARMRFRLREPLFLIYLASLMIPGQVTLIPNFILMRKLGLYDTHLGIILPAAFTAFGTFLFRQHFLTLPKELDEAAKIDGASWFQIFSRVALPLAGPVVATQAIMGFTGSWNSYLWPMIMISSEEKRTVTLAVRSFASSYGTHWTQLMAATFMALLPILIVFFLLQKHFIKGIATTGMGGR